MEVERFIVIKLKALESIRQCLHYMNTSKSKQKASKVRSPYPIVGLDQVFVLSVKSFSERIQHIESELSNHSIPFEFIFDFDVPDITQRDLEIFAPSNMEIQHQSLVLKNIAVWKRMRNEGLDRVLVLEDDALLSENFIEALKEILEAADNLDPGYLIFLGGADTKLPKDFLNTPSTLVQRRMTTADGYIIDRCIAGKRLDWLKKNTVTMPADGLMCKIDDDIGMPHFWPKISIIQQASCTGKFKTTLDGSRLKHGLFYIRLIYQWKKIKNQSVKRLLNRLTK